MRIDLDAAAGLVLLKFLLALFLELRLVGVAVVVERTYLVDPKQTLCVADVTRRICIEMNNGAVLKFAGAGADQVVDAAVDRRQCEIKQIRVDFIGIVDNRRQ